MVQKICIRSYVLVVTLTFADYYYLAQRINSIQRNRKQRQLRNYPSIAQTKLTFTSLLLNV